MEKDIDTLYLEEPMAPWPSEVWGDQLHGRYRYPRPTYRLIRVRLGDDSFAS